MRIAFLLPVNGISGGIFVACQQAEALRRAGHEVELLFEVFRPEEGLAGLPGLSLPLRALSDALSEPEYDLVISSWWGTFFRAFELQAKRYVYFVQSDERRFYPPGEALFRSLVEFSYGVPGVGLITEAGWIREMLSVEFNRRAQYAPNGVDTSLFTAQGEALDQKQGFRILIEGPGGFPYKRIADAFAAARSVEGAEVWYVCSDNHVEPDWQAERVLHRVPYAQMPAVYRSCDVLLKLSAVEGFFGPPLEMMACGGLAVVSDVSGHEEYIVPEENALVVPIGDIEGAARALRRLRDDPALCSRLRGNGLATAARMDWKVQSPKFVKGIEKLVAELPPGQVSLPQRRQLMLLADVASGAEKLEGRLKQVECSLEGTPEDALLARVRRSPFWQLRGWTMAILYLLGRLPLYIQAASEGSLRRKLRLLLDYARVENSLLFDRKFYSDEYPEVSEAEALTHYLERGWKEGKNPSASFNTDFYLRHYPDVAASGQNPLLHYILWGMQEFRRTAV